MINEMKTITIIENIIQEFIPLFRETQSINTDVVSLIKLIQKHLIIFEKGKAKKIITATINKTGILNPPK